MLEQLRSDVCRANIELLERGLVTLTWGNASGIDRPSGLVVIKPSGVSYARLQPGQMVVVDLEGNVVEGELRPSSDTPAHLVLYRHFDNSRPFHDEGYIDKCRTSVFKNIKTNLFAAKAHTFNIFLSHPEA